MDQHTGSFGLFTGFVDNKKNIELWQPCTLKMLYLGGALQEMIKPSMRGRHVLVFFIYIGLSSRASTAIVDFPLPMSLSEK